MSDAAPGAPFGSEELLREALEEVGQAPVDSYVEEPWGSAALAAAAEVAEHEYPGALRELARLAVDRVAERSELRELGEDAVDRVAADLRARLT